MSQSRCPHRGLPEAPLQIKAINWPPTNEIDACNDDLIVAIIEVIAENTILTENYLILLGNLFKLNPKQTVTKNYEKRDMGPLFLTSSRCTEEEEGEGPYVEAWRWRGPRSKGGSGTFLETLNGGSICL